MKIWYSTNKLHEVEVDTGEKYRKDERYEKVFNDAFGGYYVISIVNDPSSGLFK